jgi:hypothetical protein
MRESDVALLHHNIKDSQVLCPCNYRRSEMTVLIMPVDDVYRCKIVWLWSANNSFESRLSAISLSCTLLLDEVFELPIQIDCGSMPSLNRACNDSE